MRACYTIPQSSKCKYRYKGWLNSLSNRVPGQYSLVLPEILHQHQITLAALHQRQHDDPLVGRDCDVRAGVPDGRCARQEAHVLELAAAVQAINPDSRGIGRRVIDAPAGQSVPGRIHVRKNQSRLASDHRERPKSLRVIVIKLAAIRRLESIRTGCAMSYLLRRTAAG